MSTPAADLRAIARARLQDARILLKARRYDGAAYLCGYAIELTLKARIVQHLRWAGFPETGGEWKGYDNLKVHNLEVLLAFSGQQDRIRTRYQQEWSAVSKWNPESRYTAVSTTAQTATDMITATAILMRAL